MARRKKVDGDARQRVPISHEVLDPTPVAIPVRLQRQSEYNDLIRQMIRSEELKRDAERAGAETFEEANDFDVGDDDDPVSPYEEDFDPVDEEVLNRLTTDEYARRVEARFKELEPLVHKRESENGGTKSDERRMGDGDDRSGRRDKVGKGKSKSKQNADDVGGVRETDSGDTRFNE